MKGGELQDYIAEYDHLSEPEAKLFLRQILSALVHLHERSIVHLDLKPENILLTEEGSRHLKLIDFGISRRFQEKADIKGIYGTPEFIGEHKPELSNNNKLLALLKQKRITKNAKFCLCLPAPEILNYEPIGYGTDLWSIGCIAYTMYVWKWK